ncbi:PD-(D/E)XK nuclease family protein [Wolbachia endosymbiont of Dirofilaria (Dirofilaria) immitis]|uniref:PD-(D/E)XK nuclease family protein n=1 Tax=Wolbachia endosymbiont of Dirofilaria (Dirofilaria) immitis TaxID=1812115 RepID=UPI00158EB886|nr:PD-(D/E)XK nuclease family protein [Wolbachia endosymbiont of Dirofilaria (Dirofilaria) immitis]QKX02386.1 recombinase RecB [Wolbachia endosymbiont of Dirofilaria (Dirofilaria) immitis]
MKKIFTINAYETFFDVLVQHIFSEYEKEKIPEIKIILPCKRDVIALLSASKSHSAKKCIILPEVVSLENINEEDSILNLDKIRVIKPIKRMLLLIQFILKWNKKNNDTFPIDLACSLPLLLDEIQAAQTIDYYQPSEHPGKIESFINLLIETWDKTLRNLGVIDISKHKSDYIKNMIASLKKDQHVIFVGIGKGKIYKLLIKAIYDIPLGKIILPNLNLKIKEKNWKSLGKRHYQHSIKDLLDYLNVDRKDVSLLKETNITATQTHKAGICDQGTVDHLDYIFDTTTDLNKVSNEYIKNIEVITCDSKEEEAQVISLIIKNEGHENVSLVVLDKLLATRIACLSKPISENYSYIMLLLNSIEVLTSNWNSVALLALLKHKLVTFGHSQEKYAQILSEFEIEVLRNFNTNGLSDIINSINIHEKLKYKEDILFIINNLKIISNILYNVTDYFIYDIVTAHLQCINMLSNINFLELDNKIGDFVRDFLNACKGVTIKCSLELYKQILMLFLKKEFFSITSNFNRLSLYHNRVTILAGFYDMPSFQNPLLNALTREKFNLPSIQEKQGYFLYTLRNLFGASKVYITRLLSDKKPTILSRLEVLLQKPKYPYCDWLRILNTPEYVVPYTQPIPKPQAKVREEKMQVISCSAVEKLIRNPYSFYVEYILNLKQLRDLNFKPSILEFGTVVHSIFKKHSCDRKPLMSIAHEVFSTSQFHFSSIWWARLQRVIQSFVKLDKDRNNHVELEKSFSYPISHIPTHTDSYVTWMTKEISLIVRCDRVEYLPSGQVAIIDYKFGSSPSNKEIMSGFFPQLILQALAVEHTTKREVSELAYWKFDYDKIKVTTLKNYRLKMQEFQDNLPSFLSNYLRETTPFIASPYFDKFLRFNSYKQLERIEEWL